MTGAWDAFGSDGRNINAANFEFTTTATDNDVTFYLNPQSGLTKVEVIPEPATLGLRGFFGASLFVAHRKFKT